MDTFESTNTLRDIRKCQEKYNRTRCPELCPLQTEASQNLWGNLNLLNYVLFQFIAYLLQDSYILGKLNFLKGNSGRNQNFMVIR